MEDFSNVWTIEFYTVKGWEVIRTFEGMTEAIEQFRRFCLSDEGFYRLTTPMS